MTADLPEAILSRIAIGGINMTNKMKECHSGIGGLYFIVSMCICAFIMFAAVKLSWESQAVAISDNLAYIAAINIAANGYVDQVTLPAGTYNGDLPYPNHPYNPLSDYNSMLRSAGIVDSSPLSGCTDCHLVWDGHAAQVQFGPFRTTLGSYVMPHKQESVIERN